jgi:hypothetical protein
MAVLTIAGPIMPQNLTLKGAAITSIATEAGYTVVVFRPTKQTLKAVEAAKEEDVTSTLVDPSGEFVRSDPLYLADYEYNELLKMLVVDFEHLED